MQYARDVEIKWKMTLNHLLHSVYKWMDHTCSLEKGWLLFRCAVIEVFINAPPHYCVVSQSVLFVNKSPSLVHLPLKKVSSFFNMCWLNYFLVDVCFMVTKLPRPMHSVLVVLISTKINLSVSMTLFHYTTWWLHCMKSRIASIATPIAKGFFVHRQFIVLHGPQKNYYWPNMVSLPTNQTK